MIFIIKWYLTAVKCGYDSGPFNVSIPVDKTSFTHRIDIYDDDVFERDDHIVLEIDESSLHKQVKMKEPYKTNVAINDDEKCE